MNIFGLLKPTRAATAEHINHNTYIQFHVWSSQHSNWLCSNDEFDYKYFLLNWCNCMKNIQYYFGFSLHFTHIRNYKFSFIFIYIFYKLFNIESNRIASHHTYLCFCISSCWLTCNKRAKISSASKLKIEFGWLPSIKRTYVHMYIYSNTSSHRLPTYLPTHTHHIA